MEKSQKFFFSYQISDFLVENNHYEKLISWQSYIVCIYFLLMYCWIDLLKSFCFIKKLS